MTTSTVLLNMSRYQSCIKISNSNVVKIFTDADVIVRDEVVDWCFMTQDIILVRMIQMFSLLRRYILLRLARFTEPLPDNE